MNIYYYQTLIGEIGIADDENSVTKIFTVKAEADKAQPFCRETDLTRKAFIQIEEYLKGTRTEFDFSIQLNGTPFQKKVWAALRQIPYGTTVSYKQIGESINEPKKYRAIGGACNKNPLLLAVPCHRVIGSDGKLTGFAAGVEVKKQLLSIEKRPT